MPTPRYPQTLIRCPCADTSSHNSILNERYLSTSPDTASPSDTLNPFDMHSNFTLFPLSHLMFCEGCAELRCPRCTLEEIVCWFCPHCCADHSLVQVEHGQRRCVKECFACPVCAFHLSVHAIRYEDGSRRFLLDCAGCRWSSLDIGLRLESERGIAEQLKVFNQQRKSARLTERKVKGIESRAREEQFENLRRFNEAQLANAGYEAQTTSVGSPSLARLMSKYGKGKASNSSSKGVVREARLPDEGARVIDLDEEDDELAAFLAADDSQLTTAVQRRGKEIDTRWMADLTPQAMPLRTKRSRRCRMCRHILVRPKAEPRKRVFGIGLFANKYCPDITLAPLLPPPEPDRAPTRLDFIAIPVYTPVQFLLTFRNPQFSKVKVSLATPRETPGPFPHTVTLLCPQFELRESKDFYEELDFEQRQEPSKGNESRVAEAGKVWSSEKNSTTVVMEVVCSDKARKRTDKKNNDKESKEEKEEIREQDKELKIPIYLRMEYEVEVGEEKKKKRERWELAYWVVLEVGRVALSPIS